jgi:hypothetical protein
MFMIYFDAKFHIPRSNGPLIVTVKLKAKENFWMDATLLFCILICLSKSCIYLNYLLPYTILGHYIKGFQCCSYFKSVCVCVCVGLPCYYYWL